MGFQALGCHLCQETALFHPVFPCFLPVSTWNGKCIWMGLINTEENYLSLFPNPQGIDNLVNVLGEAYWGRDRISGRSLRNLYNLRSYIFYKHFFSLPFFLTIVVQLLYLILCWKMLSILTQSLSSNTNKPKNKYAHTFQPNYGDIKFILILWIL